MKRILLLIIPFMICLSCHKTTTDNGTLTIVATTGMIADAAENIVKDRAIVEPLMGPGVDPHLYKATQGDLNKLRSADVILYNGLHLEGKMGEIVDKIGRQTPVVAVAEAIDKDALISNPQYQGTYDPHVWFDVSLWMEVVKVISKKVQEIDPSNAAYYEQNTMEYLAELEQLHQWVKEQILQIPQQQRIMITAHDAFQYFGRAYDIDVRGLQGISTISEYGLQDITNMADLIAKNKIKAVFVESSVPDKALRAVVAGVEDRGHQVKIGGTLFSDAMGTKGTSEGTYTGMVRANVNTIVSSLK